MDKYNKMIELLQEVQVDVEKFYEKGNKAAGTRVRKSMQELKALAQDLRVDISNIKNGAK